MRRAFDVFEEPGCVRVVLYLCRILELCPHVNHAADMVYVEHLIVKAKVHVVAVGLKGTEFTTFQDVPQHLTPTRSILIIIHGHFRRLVHQAPYIPFPVLAAHLHAAPGLVAVHHEVIPRRLSPLSLHGAEDWPAESISEASMSVSTSRPAGRDSFVPSKSSFASVWGVVPSDDPSTS